MPDRSASEVNFKSMEEFRKHYLPRASHERDEQKDMRAAAEQRAGRTIRSVRRQLALHR